ncbi:hypothetical protein VP01_2576g3 [Puccinia sorghi]|uniref:Uncharacterized protein n=1 Tax=Puccinia sorghi TaxID=27349 RepID=A0A0L6V4W9_9BASI|nr:hypothetical protein VP01_2576g3 [Puccinia sorghi]
MLKLADTVSINFLPARLLLESVSLTLGLVLTNSHLQLNKLCQLVLKSNLVRNEPQKSSFLLSLSFSLIYISLSRFFKSSRLCNHSFLSLSSVYSGIGGRLGQQELFQRALQGARWTGRALRVSRGCAAGGLRNEAEAGAVESGRCFRQWKSAGIRGCGEELRGATELWEGRCGSIGYRRGESLGKFGETNLKITKGRTLTVSFPVAVFKEHQQGSACYWGLRKIITNLTVLRSETKDYSIHIGEGHSLYPLPSFILTAHLKTLVMRTSAIDVTDYGRNWSSLRMSRLELIGWKYQRRIDHSRQGRQYDYFRHSWAEGFLGYVAAGWLKKLEQTNNKRGGLVNSGSGQQEVTS